MNARVHMILEGRVQGVGFRYSARVKAKIMGINGWIRNNEDGTVEIVAEGEEKMLLEFLSYVKKGPSLARVTDFKIEWLKYQNEFSNFTIKYA